MIIDPEELFKRIRGKACWQPGCSNLLHSQQEKESHTCFHCTDGEPQAQGREVFNHLGELVAFEWSADIDSDSVTC